MAGGYSEIAKKITENILSGKYPDTLPSIATLSAKLKVCPATVKRVISQLRDWDFVSGEPGRCVRVNPKAVNNPFFHKNVVVLINITVINNPFYAQVVENINRRLNEKHICLHLFVSVDQFRECGFEPDCVIVVSGADSAELEEYCKRKRIIRLNIPKKGFHNVFTDNEYAGYHAVGHLAEAGHSRIGILATQLNYDYSCFYERFCGAMAYAKEHPEIFVTIVELNENIRDTGLILPAVEDLMKRDPGITAIFSSCDLFALGVYAYAVKHGLKIPEDLSVIGFDNQDFSVIQYPPLSTFSECSEEAADHLFRLILEVLQSDRKTAYNISVQPKIIPRSSVARREI